MNASLLPLWLASAIFPVAAASPASADKLLILGDSISKEYQVEWYGIGGDPLTSPKKNWNEILDDRRGNYFDFGGFSTYADWRLVGHDYNWSIPGSETPDWVSNLEDPPDDLVAQLDGRVVDRAVVWLGGNDVRVKYQDLYEGRPAAAWIDGQVANITAVLDFVEAHYPGLPTVLVDVPHLGATPDIDGDHPYDPVKTPRVTAALDELNARLVALARNRGIGFADVYFSMTRELVTAPRWVIGGYRVEKTTSSTGDPDALFLGDGFHPNMPAQAVFAQRIIDAFNERYGPQIPRLANREILVNVLGVSASMTMDQWVKGYGVGSGDRGFADDPDGDRVKNILEFALDMDPIHPDTAQLPQPWLATRSGAPVLRIRWQPRDPGGVTYASLVLEESTDLLNWSPVPAAAITSSAFNTLTAERPADGGRRAFRFRATMR